MSYTINLDSPGSERWNHVLKDYQAQIHEMRKEIDAVLIKAGYNLIFGSMVNAFINANSKNIMYYDELCSISKFIGLPLDKVLGMQLIYELSSACTTIVSLVEGQETMFRTMDWEMPFLKSLTIDVEFVSKNRVIFKGTTWVGYVGILTGLNIEHQYSLAVNYRRTKSVDKSALLSNVISIINMNWPVGYLMREIFENNLDISETRHRLSLYPLVSPTYITICCPKNSFILVRDPGQVHEVIERKSDASLIQTNLDRDKTEPNILYSCQRRELCKSLLDSNNLSLEAIKRGINAFPVINSQTIYCNVIIPSTGYYSTSLNGFIQN